MTAYLHTAAVVAVFFTLAGPWLVGLGARYFPGQWEAIGLDPPELTGENTVAFNLPLALGFIVTGALLWPLTIVTTTCAAFLALRERAARRRFMVVTGVATGAAPSDDAPTAWYEIAHVGASLYGSTIAGVELTQGLSGEHEGAVRLTVGILPFAVALVAVPQFAFFIVHDRPPRDHRGVTVAIGPIRVLLWFQPCATGWACAACASAARERGTHGAEATP